MILFSKFASGGRFDIRDKDIIDNLETYVFNDGVKKKVYLVFTNAPPIYCRTKDLGIAWLNEQCQAKASGISGEGKKHIFKKSC